MPGPIPKDRRALELFLVLTTIGASALFAMMGPYKGVVLNLFYLPIVLSGYYLGRTTTGVLALLCVLVVTIATTSTATGFAAYDSPLMVGLMLTIWGSALGLVAILVGTLCDARATTVRELHRAYVGVVEVLSKYLQGGNLHVKARSVRVAELSQVIAEELGLPPKQVDDIRVAALLHDLTNLEITTQVLSKAFDALEDKPSRHTFCGTELVHSLASVLDGALPLLAGQDDAASDFLTHAQAPPVQTVLQPMGAQIIRAARAYDDALGADEVATPEASAVALRRLRAAPQAGYDTIVLDALERAVRKRSHERSRTHRQEELAWVAER
ncbi:MAG: HD domain-containing protein [Phycisphaerae bacterium]|jgi:hypothetical protein